MCLRVIMRIRLSILFGIEIGVQPHLAFKLAEYARTYEFDFIIASSHVCNRQGSVLSGLL